MKPRVFINALTVLVGRQEIQACEIPVSEISEDYLLEQLNKCRKKICGGPANLSSRGKQQLQCTLVRMVVCLNLHHYYNIAILLS